MKSVGWRTFVIKFNNSKQKCNWVILFSKYFFFTNILFLGRFVFIGIDK